MATPAPKARKASELTQAPIQTTVLVANQHSGPIILPRVAIQGEQRIQLNPTILYPGTVTPVDGDIWSEHLKLIVIQHYLDKRLLAVVQSEGLVPISDTSSTDLEGAIPENLKTEEELGNTGATAKVVRQNAGTTAV